MKIVSKDISKVIKGANELADIVGSTLGPKGKNVILDKGWGTPMVTNDGVSIAREIELEDELKNQGAELIKEVAMRTNEQAGDGTTTSIVLAQAILNEGINVSESGMEVKNSLDEAGLKIIEELKKISKPVKGKKDLLSVATISAEDK